MVTKVGADSFGRDTIANYGRLGISEATVLTTPDAATGMAMICVGALASWVNGRRRDRVWAGQGGGGGWWLCVWLV
jgi:hypothetical protein